MKSPRFLRRALLTAVAVAALAAPLLSPAAAPAQAVTPVTSSASQHAPTIVKTADLNQFRPGNIIADSIFFDSSTMNAGQIDAFLRSKVSSCQSGYTCLKDYRQPTPNRGADKYCNGYQGSGDESAATILAKVAQSCGINPQVFIVMLQKEQGLVTHTWPSKWRYDMAFGMACPDDAPCDSAYAGFFNQVYGAGRQMKIYAENYWFTWFAPGNTWQIQYNPNTGCGRGPVYVENTATAALYYYTPYQPNAAALRAGYGEGDGCSAYGNRNFYNYFNDWFGSTQLPQSGLVRPAGSDRIFLIAEGQKHHVRTSSDLRVFESRLGAFQTVSATALNGVPQGVDASRLVRDGRDGALFLLQPGGTKHHFPTFAVLRQYGFNSDQYTALSGGQIDAFPTGTSVANFFRSEANGDYFKYEGGMRRHIANDPAWQSVRREAGDYVAVLPDANVRAIPVGSPFLAAGTLAREMSQQDVYILGTGLETVRIPTWGHAVDAGVTALGPVPDMTLRFHRSVGTLTALVQCPGGTYALDGGRLTAVTSVDRAYAGISLPASLCDVLPKSQRTVGGALLVKSPTADAVYVYEQGKLRHLRSAQRLLEVVGGGSIDQVSWSDATIRETGVGAPYFADGEFVSFGAAEIYIAQGPELRHVTSPAVLNRLTGGRTPTVLRVAPEFFSLYALGAPITQ